MSRILTIFSLLIMLAGAGYLFKTGQLKQLFDPQVKVAVATEEIRRFRPLLPTMFELENRSLNSLEPGLIVYPVTTTKDEVVQADNRVVLMNTIQAGQSLRHHDVSREAEVFVIRAISNIAEGQALDRSNVIITRKMGEFANGEVVFSDRREAMDVYFANDSLRAARPIEEGTMIKVDDIGSSGPEQVYVLVAREARPTGSLMTLGDIDVLPRRPKSIPRGAVSFPNKQAGEIFVSTSGGITLAFGLRSGDVLDVSAIGKTGGDPMLSREMPQTLDEYLTFEVKYPGTSMLVDDTILIGNEPLEGDRVDAWVEMESTEGPYGIIKIRRVVDDALLMKLVNKTMSDDSEEEVTDFLYWSKIGEAGHKAIAEARNDDRLAFMVADSTSITDFIGNGAVCKDSICSISRTVSRDLSLVRTAFDDDGRVIAEDEMDGNDPLTVLDGVDREVEARLIARGHKTFRDIAAWDDASLRVISFNVEISQNLATYIRQQARNIIENPEKSREDLGLSNGDVSK